MSVARQGRNTQCQGGESDYIHKQGTWGGGGEILDFCCTLQEKKPPIDSDLNVQSKNVSPYKNRTIYLET